MSILTDLFSKKKEEQKSSIPEVEKLFKLAKQMESILDCTHFVAKSEYLYLLPEWQKTVDYFNILKASGMLETFCGKNGISAKNVNEICNRYRLFEKLVEVQNERFIKEEMVREKDYLDNILKACDPHILLDEDQRRVVLNDEDYCLVVAGAGAGKTTTVAAKVKYLVDKKGIDPKQILVVSFTNKAVNELKQRIVGDLHIECPIATFHSTGNAILHKQNPEKLNIADESKLYYVIQEYFRGSILQNEKTVENLIRFFASYFDAPLEEKELKDFFNNLAKSNYSTMRSEFEDFKQEVIDIRTKKAVTILSEVMRSNQEVEIANFLYLNNIDYEYEPLYQYNIQFARKPYTPDFVIAQGDKVAYIEHFGITEDGRNKRYSSDQLESYKKAIVDKIRLHKQHGTTLIYTFSSFNDGRSITEHLRESLEKNGFVLMPRSNQEIMEKLITSEENRYIRKLVSLLCRFIQNFKVNGYTQEDFDRMYHSTQNVRSRLFLNICRDCYLEYQRYLKKNDAVDFEDMINESARILREVKEMKQKLDFKYIIVDEYQDISRQRFDLVSALHEVTDAKIIAVGDDWQSIYAFSGSDITLFTNFAEKMGYASLLKIVRTYRNSQEVIDIAGNFIQKNKSQIQKDLISNKNIEDPVIIYTYNAKRKGAGEDNRSGVNFAIAHAIEVVLKQIMEYNRLENKPYNSSILLIGRYGFDGDHLERSGLFEYVNRGSKIRSVKYPKLNITFMTAHASKGLGYDNVIVINGRNETYGFPSKIEDDPVLSFVIRGDRSIDYAEERRLFYVAMTRTKNRVFFIAPEQNPSEFLLELKRDYKNVELRGEWNEDPSNIPNFKKTCPICGYPMQYRYKKAYGLPLHICTNEPEVCGFMTNQYRAGKLSITKCDQCRDGYLIIKPGKDGNYFLGCTNYKKDKTGCNNVITKDAYYKMMGYKDDAVPLINPVRKTKSSDTSPTEPVADNKIPELKEQVLFKGIDLNNCTYTALSCLHHISVNRFYGVTVLVDVLRGSESERIKKSSLNSVPEWAAFKQIPREDVRDMIYWLIENGFIHKTKEYYPVLHPTYNSAHYDEVITVGKLKKLKDYLEE